MKPLRVIPGGLIKRCPQPRRRNGASGWVVLGCIAIGAALAALALVWGQC